MSKDGQSLDALLAPNDIDPSAALSGLETPVQRCVHLMDKWHALIGTMGTIETRLRSAARGSQMEQLQQALLGLQPVVAINAIIDRIVDAPDETPLGMAVPLHANQLQHDLAKYGRCNAQHIEAEKELMLHYSALRHVLSAGLFAGKEDLPALVAQARASLPPRVDYHCDCAPTTPLVSAGPQRTIATVYEEALDRLPVHVDQQRTLTWFLRRGHGTPLPAEFPLWLGSAVTAHHKRKRLREQVLRVTGLESVTNVGELKRARTKLVAQYALNLAPWQETTRALDAFVDKALPVLTAAAAAGLPLAVLEEWLPVAHVGDDLCDTCGLPMGMETTGATTCAFCPPRPPPQPSDPMELSPVDDSAVIPFPHFLSQQ